MQIFIFFLYYFQSIKTDKVSYEVVRKKKTISQKGLSPSDGEIWSCFVQRYKKSTKNAFNSNSYEKNRLADQRNNAFVDAKVQQNAIMQ